MRLTRHTNYSDRRAASITTREEICFLDFGNVFEEPGRPACRQGGLRHGRELSGPSCQGSRASSAARWRGVRVRASQPWSPEQITPDTRGQQWEGADLALADRTVPTSSRSLLTAAWWAQKSLGASATVTGVCVVCVFLQLCGLCIWPSLFLIFSLIGVWLAAVSLDDVLMLSSLTPLPHCSSVL